MFDFPIGIQLFNRPDYARQLLHSLRVQTAEVTCKNVYIYIDGFSGSFYEEQGAKDQTGIVEGIARDFFPQASIKRFATNQGIANLRNQLQIATFSSGSSWGAFFEEDIVLDPSYLLELSELIAIVEPFDEVAKVACFQILDRLRTLPRGLGGFYPGYGTQAVAERLSFFNSKQEILAKYIDLTSKRLNNASVFKDSEIAAILARSGYLLAYVQHDSLEEQLLRSQGKLHVVTKPNLAKDIGIDGVHSYVTKPIASVGVPVHESLEIRKNSFENQLHLIVEETSQASYEYFKEILDGYHTSNSRKRMLTKILKISIGK